MGRSRGESDQTRQRRRQDKILQNGVIITFGLSFSFFPPLSLLSFQLDDNKAPSRSPPPNPGLVGVTGILPLPPTSSGRIAALTPYEGPYGLNFGAGTLAAGFDTGDGDGEVRAVGWAFTEGVRDIVGVDGMLGVEAVGDGGEWNCSWCFLMIGSTISSCV